jgi:hypothetical protein
MAGLILLLAMIASISITFNTKNLNNYYDTAQIFEPISYIKIENNIIYGEHITYFIIEPNISYGESIQ